MMDWMWRAFDKLRSKSIVIHTHVWRYYIPKTHIMRNVRTCKCGVVQFMHHFTTEGVKWVDLKERTGEELEKWLKDYETKE
jgi:hypothetical protein